MCSDPIKPEDLRSNTAYRLGTHREFIRWHPGSYARLFLGKRLGVSPRTTANYDKAIGTDITRNYKYRPITQDNLDTQDWDKLTYGPQYLRDGRGWKYRPTQEIASKLLAEGRTVWIVICLANHYELEDRSA